MGQGGESWKLGELSDHELLCGLDAVIRSGRRSLAELLAHLAELEERRLHLRAAHSSLFSYCVTKLGFSEDEACRRIDVARLARRFPALFPLLASGELSLSVAALLKPHLAAANSAQLLAAVAGKTLQQAREVLAAFFPQPDAPSVVRKLPERTRRPVAGPPASAADANTMPFTPSTTSARAPSVAPSAPGPSVGESSAPLSVGESSAPLSEAESSVPAPVAESSVAESSVPAAMAKPSVQHASKPLQRVVPLAPARFKIEFTADAQLKAQLELARDLMRHANPSGDFAPIFARALELLIAEIQKRRFGSRTNSAVASKARQPAVTDSGGVPCSEAPCSEAPCSEAPCSEAASSEAASTGIPSSEAASTDVPSTGRPNEQVGAEGTGSSSYIPRATRRSVAERDGLRCCWTDETGKRCDSQAWLEHDHVVPRGKGGGAGAGNVRMFCRNHNRLEAERQFGREHVDAAIARARAARRQGREVRRGGSVVPDH